MNKPRQLRYIYVSILSSGIGGRNPGCRRPVGDEQPLAASQPGQRVVLATRRSLSPGQGRQKTAQGVQPWVTRAVCKRSPKPRQGRQRFFFPRVARVARRRTLALPPHCGLRSRKWGGSGRPPALRPGLGDLSPLGLAASQPEQRNCPTTTSLYRLSFWQTVDPLLHTLHLVPCSEPSVQILRFRPQLPRSA